MKFYEEVMENIIARIKDCIGEDIVILVRLDLESPYSPIHVFSRYLNKSQQRRYLIYLSNFLRENGVLLSYSIFGPYISLQRKNKTKRRGE